MMVSTKGRYALRVMIDLAEHQAEGYIPLKAIARRQDISEKYLESILKSLVQSQFLTGVRGKGGGYRLTRPPEQYTVGSILRLTEGSLAPWPAWTGAGGMSAQGRMPHAAHVAEAERAGAGLSGRRHAGKSDGRGPVRRPLCDLTRLRSGIAVFSPFSPQKPGAHRQSQKFGHNDGEPDAVRPHESGQHQNHGCLEHQRAQERDNGGNKAVVQLL